MFVQQIYTNCLAHAAYYIESGNEAVIIDPLRNPEPYTQLAKERGKTIKYVLETHFHADFVSGHLDVANEAGATIVFGPGAAPEYKAYIAEDGETLHIGDVTITVMHTPGHTLESVCYLLSNEAGQPYALFTGDTLFVGDVGRPDLLSGNKSKEELAALMYDSLEKIKALPDDVIVYPGHGAGSACGKNIGVESFSTIAHEKQFNYALRCAEKSAFVAAITSDLPAIPAYFFKDAQINKAGYNSYQKILKRNLCPLTLKYFITLQEEGTVILDTRNPMDFAAGFVPGAINIGLNGDFAVWAGTFIAPNAGIVLVTEPEQEQQAIERLARIGYDNVKGYLDGGMHTWYTHNQHFDRVLTFESTEVAPLLETTEYYLLDVRNRKEVAKHRIAGSVHIPLNQLKEKYKELDENKHLLVYCAGGYRSMIAASFLKANGFHFVACIEGGINEVAQKSPELLEIDTE